MADDLAKKNFDRMKEIWSPIAGKNRVIPFCTPVISRPRALVIGTNHSDFVKGGGPEADRIADELAASIPTRSTFLYHSHKFAQGLLAVCSRAGICVDDQWMGTNRCAVQTGPDGIEELRSQEVLFSNCQDQMDRLLCELIDELRPHNVLLVGSYAMELFYPPGTKMLDPAMKPIRRQANGATIPIIAIPHPSRAAFWALAANRLREHFVV